MMRASGLALVAAGTCLAARAPAQESSRPPWAGSARAASVQLTDTSTVNALSAAFEYRAREWLTLGAAPSLVRATNGATTASGVGVLPLAVEASGRWASSLRPELGASLIVVLPTSQSSCAVGGGGTSVGMQVGTGFNPSESMHFWGDAARSFSGAITLSSVNHPQATWVDLGGDLDLTPRWTLSLSAGGEVGGFGSSTPDREVGGGVSYTLAGSLNLAIDATHRIAGEAPVWGLAVSFGTASSVLSPLNSPAPIGQQRQIVTSVNASARGRGRPGSGSGGGTQTTTTCP